MFFPAKHWPLKGTWWPCIKYMCRLITELDLPITLYHLDDCWQCSFSSLFVVLITEWITSFKRLCCMIHGDWAKWISVLCRQRTCSQVAMQMYAWAGTGTFTLVVTHKWHNTHTHTNSHKHEHSLPRTVYFLQELLFQIGSRHTKLLWIRDWPL